MEYGEFPVAMKAQCVYIVIIMKAQISTTLHRGFALIATISVLILLTLIAVAFLSLSAVTVSSSRIEWAEEEARANARLALMIAIGELQREMGPDRRVSANAAVLDSTPNSLDVSGVDQPYWTAVWSTDWTESSQGVARGEDDYESSNIWERNDEAGGLADLRNVEGWDRESAVQTYLVSGNEGGRQRRLDAGLPFYDAKKGGVATSDEEEQYKIVSTGSVSDPEDMVDIRKVTVTREQRGPDGTLQYRPTGRYGWWVSDEGVKVSVDVTDRHSEEQPSPQNEDGYKRIFHAQDIASEVITDYSEIDADSLDRIISPQTIRLTGAADEDAIKDTYHDVTANTMSLLVNVRDGGLLKDLNVYMNERGDIDSLDNSRIEYLGLNDLDQMVGLPNESHRAFRLMNGDNRLTDISPQFQILKRWMQDSNTHNFVVAGKDVDLEDGQNDLKPEGEYEWNLGSGGVYDGLLGSTKNIGVQMGVDKSGDYDQVTIAPVVVEASLYYNLAFVQNGTNYVDYILMYPRVALWNPYNVTMKVPPMACFMHTNGNKRCKVTYAGGDEGGTKTGDVKLNYHGRIVYGNGHNNYGGTGWLLADVTNGTNIQGVEIPPGETLIFSVDVPNSIRTRNQPRLIRNYSKSNIMNNLLSPKQEMNAQNFLLLEQREGTLTRESTGDVILDSYRPLNYREEPRGGSTSKVDGGDNYMFMIKDASSVASSARLTGLDGFQSLPMLTTGSISLQAGGSDELPLVWRNGETHPVYQLAGGPTGRLVTDGTGTNGDPNMRTRDGFRLRWFNEHEGNLNGANQLDVQELTKMFQTASIGNWNPRASYICRNPFDNVSDQPPYFFGNYTRDAFSDAVSFENMLGRSEGGVQKGFPFGPPNSEFNNGPVVLFEFPSKDIGIPNLAYLRHLKMSEFPWQPTYAIANSIACPRSGPSDTAPDPGLLSNTDNGGWNGTTMGANSGRTEYWAELHMEFIGDKPRNSNVVFDLSFEANYNLWDTYFISTNAISSTQRNNQMARFAENPSEDPLPNSRYALISRPDLETKVADDLNDFYRTAARMAVRGGFNVHSTSIEAWKAFLSSTIDVPVNGSSNEVVFPRFLNPIKPNHSGGGLSEEGLSGNRVVSEDQIESLAEAMVAQVKRRAPFMGLSDFVNRRLTDKLEDVDLARAGAIEAALENSGMNFGMSEGVLGISGRDQDLDNASFFRMSDSTRLDHRMKPESQAWGLSGYLTQGDVLGVIGSNITARSDTFKVRAYGESTDINGNVIARAWCEATVQRTPEPVDPDQFKINPIPKSGDDTNFGRRFKMVGFRWLSEKEV